MHIVHHALLLLQKSFRYLPWCPPLRSWCLFCSSSCSGGCSISLSRHFFMLSNQIFRILLANLLCPCAFAIVVMTATSALALITSEVFNSSLEVPTSLSMSRNSLPMILIALLPFANALPWTHWHPQTVSCTHS